MRKSTECSLRKTNNHTEENQMARKKTLESKKNFDEGPLLESEFDSPVIAQQRHRIVTEYTKAVPVDETIDADTDDENDDGSLNVEPAPNLPEDPIEKLLREIGASTSNWTLIVDRLPNFQRDGMSHTRVKFVRCGMFVITPELLNGEAYIEEIQSKWARPGKANDFRLCVRRDAKIYCYLPVLTLEPPDAEVIAKQTANEQPQFNFNLPVQENTLDAFLKQAEKFAKLRSVFGWEPTQQQGAPAGSQPLTTE